MEFLKQYSYYIDSGAGTKLKVEGHTSGQGRKLRGDRRIVPLKYLGGGDGVAFIPANV